MLTSLQLKKICLMRDKFMKVRFDRTLTLSQQRFSNIILKKVFNNEGGVAAGEFSRQQGKTECVAGTTTFLNTHYFSIVESLKLPYTDFFNVGFFAPQQEQAKTDFDRIKNQLDILDRTHDYDFSIKESNGTTLTMKSQEEPEKQTFCFSASPTSNTESKTLNLIFLEEAQGIMDEKIDNTISPMGAHTNALKVYIGTAGCRRCRFHSIVESLPREDVVIAPVDVALRERQILYEKTGNPVFLNYAKFIENEKRIIGENSDAYKMQYLLEWILARGQFITYQELFALEQDYTPQMVYGIGEPLCGGLDFGKMHDSTVFTIVGKSTGRIVDWLKILGDDYSSQYEQIEAFINPQYTKLLQEINCDATGNQDMAVDELRKRFRQYGINVNGIKLTAQMNDMMYKNLSMLMKPTYMDGRVIRPPFLKMPKANSPEKDEFVRQFLDLQKEIKTNLLTCNAPNGANFHDDFCDSLALAALPLSPMRQNVVFTRS